MIKILRGEGHQMIQAEGTPYVYLVRGDLLPWEIAANSLLYGPEIGPMFNSVGLKIEQLQAYIDKYCSDSPRSSGPVLN